MEDEISITIQDIIDNFNCNEASNRKFLCKNDLKKQVIFIVGNDDDNIGEEVDFLSAYEVDGIIHIDLGDKTV